MDFGTARLLGVRANRVIGGAVLVSGVLAAVVAVMLTVQNPLVTPDFALRDTIVVLAGVVLGGLNRPIPATLGGFSIGFASGLLGGALPTNQSQYLPTFLFAAVILVLLVRPNGLFTRTASRWSACEAPRTVVQLAAPAALVVAAALARHARLAVERGLLHRLARQGVDRRRALRLHRQLRRPFVRPRQLRRARRLGRRRALRAGRREARDHAEPRRLPPRPHGRQRAVARARGARRRRLRARRRPRADAALGPRRRHRDVRRARDHAQRASATTRRSAPA